MTRTAVGTPDPEDRPEPQRQKLPSRRNSNTFAFRVASVKGYCTIGEYADGRPGDFWLKIDKQGSTLAGILDGFAISVSLGLQYGIPLRVFVEKFVNMRFEPAGMTDDPDLRYASSILDHVFRRLALDYLSIEERMELGIRSTAERMIPTIGRPQEREGDVPPLRPSQVPQGTDAPYCMTCGVQMIRAGSCHACPSCGSTSGCS